MPDPTPSTDDLAQLPRRLLGLGPGAVRTLKYLAIAVAVAALVLGMLGRWLGWLDYQPGGAAFDAWIHPVFGLVFLVALLVALRWEIVGGLIAGFAGAAMMAFALNQLKPVDAAVVVAGFLIPAVLWIVVDINGYRPRGAALGVAATAAMAVAGFASGHAVYQHYWGPTHPESTTAAPDPSPVRWVWSGAVTSTSAEVRAKPDDPGLERARLLVSAGADLADGVWVEPRDQLLPVLGFDVTGLQADTEYHYAVEIDGALDTVRAGRFRTFPDGPADMVFALASCARVGSNGAVFDTIAAHDPLLYLITGDLHYGNVADNDVQRYREVMDLTLTRPAQAALYRSVPIAYVWDDHDYGPNNADGSSPSRSAAMAAYREYVPSYPLGGDESPVYQAFDVGRVRFIMTDDRSARDAGGDGIDGRPTMLGAEQREWLKDQLAASADHPLVVWVNPDPWVGEATPGADTWAGFADERRELANVIADNYTDNFLMLSGDAHMLAIDDGTNTNYADRPGPGFPLLQAAALDRPGSIKGGPYSDGPIPGGGHFGLVGIDDRGDEIEVTLSGRDWRDEELLRYSFVIEAANRTSPAG